MKYLKLFERFDLDKILTSVKHLEYILKDEGMEVEYSNHANSIQNFQNFFSDKIYIHIGYNLETYREWDVSGRDVGFGEFYNAEQFRQSDAFQEFVDRLKGELGDDYIVDGGEKYDYLNKRIIIEIRDRKRIK